MLRTAANEPPEAEARTRPTVAIVGGGASGMLFTAQLLHTGAETGVGVGALLVERRERLGGVAYSTTDPSHRLNVTASGMSAFPDDPDHFVRWRECLGGTASEHDAYASRAEYGLYLTDVLAAAQRRAAPAVLLERLRAEVTAVEPAHDRVTLRLAGGGAIDTDIAVLAIGNLPSAPPPGYELLAEHPSFVCDPWAPGELERSAADGDGAILLIGSGLTMVDVVLSLVKLRPGARLIAMSRSGLLPRAHVPECVAPRPAPTRIDPYVSFAELVDRALADAAGGGARWRQLVDGLRPVTQAHWRRLSFEQRAAFMTTRHREWSVHRHRMAPAVARRVAGLLVSGQLELHRGTPELVSAPRGRLTLRLPGRGRVDLSLAVNCTGPVLDPRASAQPLVHQLLAAQHVRAHPLGIGFDTAPGGAFRRPDGALHSRLLTLGPPRIGELYETTAVPEIREQARELALNVVARLTSGRGPARVSAHTA
jgi:uncharacterized NAD(P)/FAD-binding protein YdhS